MNEDEKFLFKIYINFKEERKDSWEKPIAIYSDTLKYLKINL